MKLSIANSPYPLLILSSLPSTLAECTNLPNVPPGVFNASARIEINATTAAVWDATVDFANYPSWNPFVRLALITSTLGIPLPANAQYPVENAHIIFRVQLPPLPLPVNDSTPDNPLNTQFSYENVTHVQPELGRLAWKDLVPGDELLDAERWTAISTCNGTALYESREVYRGPSASVLQTLYGTALQDAFEAQATALKLLLEGSR